MKQVTGMLKEWGDFVADHLDYADEYGESIIYRVSKLGGYVDQGQSTSKVLCEDMPYKLKKVEKGVKKLPRWERCCITAFFCAPLKDDGNPYTKRDLAHLLNINKYNFDQHLQRGKRRLEIILEIT